MFALVLKWKATCPDHPRYSPARDGRGAIKGGCEACAALAAVHEKLLLVRSQIELAEGTIDRRRLLREARRQRFGIAGHGRSEPRRANIRRMG